MRNLLVAGVVLMLNTGLALAQTTVPAIPTPWETAPSALMPYIDADAKEAPAPEKNKEEKSPDSSDPERIGEPIYGEILDGSCGDCFSCCDCCPRGPMFWGSGEYLLWWISDMPVPTPLVTQSNVADFGILGAPSTRVILGGQDVGFGENHGGRFTAGMWLNHERTIGIEGVFLFLAANEETRAVGQGSDVAGTLIANPFFNVNPLQAPLGENSLLLSFPDPLGASGFADLSVRSRLLGGEIHGMYNACRHGNLQIDLLGGFRYLNLDEDMVFRTRFVNTGIPNDINQTLDEFNTSNNFYGGQMGARVTYDHGRFFVDVTGKVALGVMNQDVTINGNFAFNNLGAGPFTVSPGGLYTQPSNIGQQDRDRFAVIPEVSVKLGYRFTDHISGFVGYTFLYVSDVARPGNQVDRAINPGQSAVFNAPFPTPGLQGFPARPTNLFESEDYWAQGINFGLELRY